ncbi:MAG: DUF2804 domain-containing protein [Candidatus Helarchaeota archaeon]
MANQIEITEPSDLFNEDGSLVQRGWARKPLLRYNKEKIGKSWWRIKEWDHFSILNKKFGFQLTIGDIGYLTNMSHVWLDFKEKKRYDSSIFKFFTKSKLLPLSSTEDSIIEFPTKRYKAIIEKKGEYRILKIDDPNFMEKQGIKGEITLHDIPEFDNTVVVTGYKEDPRMFYYNHKINYMPAKGKILIGGEEYIFDPETSFGLMDWGRGIWPYKTHWLWASGCGKLEDGTPIAFNLGYGFGDLSTHTENIFFYNGKANKLDEVVFHHEDRDPTKPWRFTSNDNRLELTLEPIIPHKEKLNFGLIFSDTALLHGTFSGKVVLDDGKTIEIKDIMGHAEDIFWRW